MPVAPTYPGVYVEELPSGVHTINGVSTAVTAFLGYFAQGPMNQATQIFSVADLERNFGSLIANSEAGYGVQQFFANGGAEAWVVRVAAVPDPGSNPPSPAPPAWATAVIPDTGGNDLLTVTAASQGQWGNSVRLAVDNNTNSPASSFNLTVTQVDSSSPPVALVTEVYRNLTLNPSDPNYAVNVVNSASALVTLQLSASGTPTTLPAPTGSMSTDISGLAAPPSPPGSPSPLALLVGQPLQVTYGTADLTSQSPLALTATPASLIDLAATLQSRLRGLGTPPAIPNATVTLIPGAGTAMYLQISAVTNPPSTFTFGGALANSLGLHPPTSTNPTQFALGATTATAGGDGNVPNASGLIGDPLAKSGLYALDNVGFNILCLPDVMNLPDSDAFAVISKAETYCASKWAFLLVDAPAGGPGPSPGLNQRDTLTGIQAWLAQNPVRSSYAALYYPRPQIPDPLNNYRLRAVAPSGTIAGLYAQTDGTRGVWKAPAGTAATLTNVSALTYVMTDAENGVLNPLAINCLRSLPVYGNVCWGARTLDGADQLASDWKYVPVRRLALYIEASLYQGTQWVVFEPNDEPLWSQIRLNVGAFMRGLFQQGAFQGSTPNSAYFVKCDSDTTTQADINLGQVNILVGFAPLKPAEFVILQIQQIAGQIPT